MCSSIDCGSDVVKLSVPLGSTWTAIEVKTGRRGYTRFSAAQNKGDSDYIRRQLERAERGEGHWSHVEGGVADLATDVIDYHNTIGASGYVLQISKFNAANRETFWLNWDKNVNRDWPTVKRRTNPGR